METRDTITLDAKAQQRILVLAHVLAGELTGWPFPQDLVIRQAGRRATERAQVGDPRAGRQLRLPGYLCESPLDRTMGAGPMTSGAPGAAAQPGSEPRSGTLSRRRYGVRAVHDGR